MLARMDPIDACLGERRRDYWQGVRDAQIALWREIHGPERGKLLALTLPPPWTFTAGQGITLRRPDGGETHGRVVSFDSELLVLEWEEERPRAAATRM